MLKNKRTGYTLLGIKNTPKYDISTLCNTYENSGLKSVDIPNKLTILQCS